MGQGELILLVAVPCALLVSLLVVILVKRLLYVVPPNQILVLSGRRNVLPDGRVVGYRIITGGRVLRLPFVERADVIDATALAVAFQVPRVCSRDGVPVDLSATATVSVCRTERDLMSFVERFLGRRREEVEQVARETLEGHLRNVAAHLTAAELHADRRMAMMEIQADAEHDLLKMGLAVDTLILHDFTPPPPARVPD
jgi:flotillin